MLEGGEPSTAADCFAFGVILYEVLQRELVAGEVAMHADLNTLTDEDALKRYASRVVEGERHVSHDFCCSDTTNMLMMPLQASYTHNCSTGLMFRFPGPLSCEKWCSSVGKMMFSNAL